MTVTKFDNNTAFDATLLNANINFISKQLLLANLNNDLLYVMNFNDTDSGGDFDMRSFRDDHINPADYVSDWLWARAKQETHVLGGTTTDVYYWDFLKSATSYADTTNSTCLITESGITAFCDVLDLFDDASIDSGIWSTATSGSSGASGSVSEASGSLTVTATGYDGNTGTASAITNGASGLDMKGQDGEMILAFTWSLTASGTGVSHDIYVYISDGTNNVAVWNKTNSSHTSDSGDIWLRVQFDNSGDQCYVSENGDDFGSAIDLSSLGSNWYLRVYSTGSGLNVGNLTSVGTINVQGVGYRKDGAAAGAANFVTALQTLSASKSTAIVTAVWEDNVEPLSVIGRASFDNGATWSTDDVWEAWGEQTAGTQLRFRLEGNKPTSITADGSTRFIPVLKAWGGFAN